MSGQWHYVRNGQSVGPVSHEELRSLLASGALDRTTQVWTEGMAAWTPAASIQGLIPIPAPAPAPAPLLPPQPTAPPQPAPVPVQAVVQPEPTPQPIAQPVVQPEPTPQPIVQPAAQPQPKVVLAPVVPAVEPAALFGTVPEGALEMLRLTKPWVRFLSVLGFIGLGFALLGGIGVAVLSVLPVGGKSFGPQMLGFGVGYIALALVYLPPVLYLSRYASRIGRLLNSGSPEDLQDALKAQKSFWKFVGVLTLVMIALYALVFAGIAVFTAMGMAKR